MNARFWDWINGGWVKITIRPDETLEHWIGGPCDEGYSCTAHTWEHTGEEVRYRCCTWGRDCDGRYENTHEAFCPIGRLKAMPVSEPNAGDPEHIPHWITGRSRQRDYTAESCGY